MISFGNRISTVFHWVSRERQRALKMCGGEGERSMNEERMHHCELQIASLSYFLDDGRPCGCVCDSLEVLEDVDV
jgi:hypothetical protein